MNRKTQKWREKMKSSSFSFLHWWNTTTLHLHLLSSNRRKWEEETKDYSANSINNFIFPISLSPSEFALDGKQVVGEKRKNRDVFHFLKRSVVLTSGFRKVFKKEVSLHFRFILPVVNTILLFLLSGLRTRQHCIDRLIAECINNRACFCVFDPRTC